MVLPALPETLGMGRLVHPNLGAYDYAVKPDEWVNIDGDVIIPPQWASTKTMGGASNVLWSGYIRDGVVEERWKAPGGLSMPIPMLRMLVLMWTHPVDPNVGYVEWFPTYTTAKGFKVLLVGLNVGGGGGGVALTDVVNYKDDRGPNGWVEGNVTLTMKIVDRVGS
jgi:hypothetical protein